MFSKQIMRFLPAFSWPSSLRDKNEDQLMTSLRMIEGIKFQKRIGNRDLQLKNEEVWIFVNPFTNNAGTVRNFHRTPQNCCDDIVIRLRTKYIQFYKSLTRCGAKVKEMLQPTYEARKDNSKNSKYNEKYIGPIFLKDKKIFRNICFSVRINNSFVFPTKDVTT